MTDNMEMEKDGGIDGGRKVGRERKERKKGGERRRG